MMSSNRTQAIDTLTSATSARSAQDDVNDYFRHSAGYWKEIYERSGFEAALYRLRRNSALALIDRLKLPPQSPILEVGCGAGLTAVGLAERGYRVDAIDSVAPMIETARKIAQGAGLQDRVRLSVGDVHGLAFRTASFAAILAMGVAPWLEALEGPLREMARVLRPGGLLLLSTDNRWCLNHILDPRCFPALRPMRRKLREMLEGARVCRPLTRPRLRMYSIKEVDRLVTAAGLNKVEGKTVGFGPFSFLNLRLLPDSASLNVHRRLQSLADRRLPFLRSTGIEYMILARKPG